MPKYCLDTSGFSNPILDMPEDIHVTLWAKVRQRLQAGDFWNGEIGKELESIFGELGQCLQKCASACCMEIGQGTWAWQSYLKEVERMRVAYKQYISEYNGNRKNTVGLNDVSIVVLGKTLKLPVMSMEKPNRNEPSEKRLKIPDLCALEGVDHLSFNEFLRAEGISA